MDICVTFMTNLLLLPSKEKDDDISKHPHLACLII